MCMCVVVCVCQECVIMGLSISSRWSLCCFTGSDSTTIVSCLHILAHTLDTR